MSCENSEPLLLETVWLNQNETEKAEAEFQKLSLKDVQIEIVDSGDEKDKACLKEETVWFKQNYYEAAEAHYQMYLAGTLNSAAATTHTPGTPIKRLHKQEQKKQSKKQRQESDVKCDAFEKKLHSNVTILSKTVKNIHDRLQDFEKIQQRKAQAIRDAVTRLTSALESCQNQLEEDLVKTSTQLSSFNVVLGDIDSLVLKTNKILEEESWDDFGSRKSFCQTMCERISNLNGEMVHCSDIIHCFQPDVSKTDINKIVGEISKISLIKKYSGLDRYISKKDAIMKNIKEIFEPSSINNSSEVSLQGSGSVSDNSENESGIKVVKVSKLKGQQKHKENKARNGKANSNISFSLSGNKSSAGAYPIGRMKMEAGSFQNASATPKKRNAQGAPNSLQKKQEPFKFRGAPLSSKNPFMHQPGLLGPRPNLMQSANQQAPFRFSNMNTMVQQSHQPPALQNFNAFQNVNPVTPGNQSAFGNLNFNFANQPCSNSSLLPNPSMNFNSSQRQVNSQGIPNSSSHMRNSKLATQNQPHGKFMKGPEQYGAQSRNAGFSFPYQRSQMGTGLLHNAQGSLMNTFTGSPQGSMEQQLNEMSHKIQQMQMAASQNYQLQRLMQETERLKQMVSQKHHQQHDRFQHQFQLLINAFMQQQQQQLTQGPQSKMAKSVMYQNSQRQRLIQNRQHQLQQQKKHKQQQNKVQQVKQEQSNNPLKKLRPETPLNPVQSRNSACGGSKLSIKLPSTNCLITKINHFDPQSPGDKHRAGISSMVVLDTLGCLAILDIINGCLKMYEVTRMQETTGGQSHNFVTRLELPRPFYMSKLKEDILVISREGKKLSLVKVSRKRLEFLRDVITDAQYYGVAYIRENLLACAAYTENRIDLVNIQDNMVHVSSLTERRRGPELVCGIDCTGSILYLERESEVAVRLVCVSQRNVEEFVVELNSRDSDVWNFTSIEDVIICGNKQSNELKLFSNTGAFLAELKFPAGSINHPFAMAFCPSGNLYIANDGDWDAEYGHYITTEINLYQFS